MLATVVATKNVIRNIFFVSALVRMIDPPIAYSSRTNDKFVCPNNASKQRFEKLVGQRGFAHSGEWIFISLHVIGVC